MYALIRWMAGGGGVERQGGRAGGSFGTVNAIQGYGEMPRHGYPVRRHWLMLICRRFLSRPFYGFVLICVSGCVCVCLGFPLYVCVNRWCVLECVCGRMAQCRRDISLLYQLSLLLPICRCETACCVGCRCDASHLFYSIVYRTLNWTWNMQA